MPSYELSLIIKAALKRRELAVTIQRACESLMERGGVIRSMENLGLKQLPYRMKCHGNSHMEGNYVLIKFDSPTKSISLIEDVMRRDLDVVRPAILRDDEGDFVRPCLREPCRFGELPAPDHERRIWKKKTLKRTLKTKKEKERLL